jgi:hypothetical protein
MQKNKDKGDDAAADAAADAADVDDDDAYCYYFFNVNLSE